MPVFRVRQVRRVKGKRVGRYVKVQARNKELAVMKFTDRKNYKVKNGLLVPIGIVGGTLALSAGAEILEGLGTPIGVKGAKALGNISKYVPTIGSVYGAGLVGKSLKTFFVKEHKKSRSFRKNLKKERY